MSFMSPEDEEVTKLETREASPSHLLLKVESFSLLKQRGIHRYESEEFNAGGHWWRLVLCPNEDKDGKYTDYISMYLAISDTSEVNASFSIFVLDQILSNYHCSPGRTRRFMAVESEWGFSKFLSKKAMNDPSNGFLVNDKCVFGVEVFTVGKGQARKGRPPPFFKFLLHSMGVTEFFTSCCVKVSKNDEHDCHNETATTIMETREASPTHIMLTITSFSFLGKPGFSNCAIGKFYAGGYKWTLTICSGENKYISAYLAISDTKSLRPKTWEVNAVFSILLFNQISAKYHYSLGRTRRFLAVKKEWGIPDFISKKALMDPSNGFLVNNTCVFGAEVFVVENSAVSECLSVKSFITPHKRDFKISNFSQLGNYWASDNFVVEGITWHIYLYPKGKNNEKLFGIYLRLVDLRRVKASFSICIKDQINNKHKKLTADSHWISPTSSDWGWPAAMDITTLEDPCNGFIVKDCIHLEIELSVQVVV